jgi:hypothetical protein
MNQLPASLDLLSGLLTLGSVLVAVWLGRATLEWALDLRGSEGEASVVWAGRDRRLAWIVFSGAACLALLQITSVVLAVVELPAILARVEENRLFPSGWGLSSYELHLAFRVLLMVASYVLAGRLTWPWFLGISEIPPGPARRSETARIAVLLGGGGLAFVLADGVSSGVQILPVSQWMDLGDPLGGYLAGWVASIGVIALLFGFISSRVEPHVPE